MYIRAIEEMLREGKKASFLSNRTASPVKESQQRNQHFHISIVIIDCERLLLQYYKELF